MGRLQDEVAVYDEVVDRFDGMDEPDLRVLVAGALVNKGAAFYTQGWREDVVALCDEVVDRFGRTDEPDLRAVVIRAEEIRAIARQV
jgi:hypothetical protein